MARCFAEVPLLPQAPNSIPKSLSISQSLVWGGQCKYFEAVYLTSIVGKEKLLKERGKGQKFQPPKPQSTKSSQGLNRYLFAKCHLSVLLILLTLVNFDNRVFFLFYYKRQGLPGAFKSFLA